MALDFLFPSWSIKYDLIFELGFTAIALVLSLFACRLYKVTAEKKTQLFAISFMLIAISYAVQFALNLIVLLKLESSICLLTNLSSVNLIGYYGNYLHFLLLIIGFAVLLYMTFDINHPEVLFFLLVLSVVTLMVSQNEFAAFYLLSTIYLAFITWHFVRNYLHAKQNLTLLVALAFAFLFFGSFHFFLSVNHHFFIIIGYFMELAAYILLLLNLYLVQK